MRILVLGGTKFIGRHIAEMLVLAGHDVSVLTRGKTADALPESVERLRGDRDAGVAGLAALANRTFDACIDVSGYLPSQVRPAAEMLRDRVGRFVFISTGAVYAPTRQVPIFETHELLRGAAEDVREINGETYGPLKVTCEAITREVFERRSTVVRPQIVAGTHDPYGRYSRWIKRAMRPGPMLMPGDGEDFVQVVDVRDVAALVRVVVETDAGGVVHAVGPRITWREFGRVLGVSDSSPESLDFAAPRAVWIPSDTLKSEGLTEQDLPLYRARGSTRSEGMHMSGEKMLSLLQAQGLTLRTPQQTCDAVRAWVAHDTATLGMPVDREMDVLARVRHSHEGVRPDN